MVVYRNFECDDYQFCLSKFAHENKIFECNGCPGPQKNDSKIKSQKPKKEKKVMKEKDEDEKLGLIEKAKSKIVKTKSLEIDPEEMELAILWLKDGLTNRQVNFAYDSKGDGGLTRMSKVIKEMYRLGKIQIK